MFVKNYEHLMQLAKEKESITIAVAAAEDFGELQVVEEATKQNLAKFVLVGDEAKIKQIIKENKMEIDSPIVATNSLEESAAKAVELVRSGDAQTVMKGMLHTRIIMRAVLNKEKGLNVGKPVTAASMMEKIDGDGFLLMTDPAIAIAPDLNTKKGMIENAVSIARGLGVEKPNVACVCAQELVNPAMADTLDAAILSKMADRGQIANCVVDGPLAFDNAYLESAAKAKGINSPVAGKTDIMMFSDIDVANSVVKTVRYIGGYELITATVGTKVPIILSSRAGTLRPRLLAVALTAYLI